MSRITLSRISLSPTSHVTWIVLITLLGFAARFINLGGDSFWFDELFTLNTSRAELSEVIAGQDISNPPGFHLIEYFAVRIWGTGEYALRLPSALAGVAAIPLVFVVGSLIANRRVGLWAAMLLAISPFHIRYSQEARAYAVQMMLTVASTAGMFLALARRSRWWAGFGILTALNAYVQFSSFVVLASQTAFVGLLALIQWLRKQWTPRQATVALGGMAVGICLALILYAPHLGSALQGVSANLGAEVAKGRWSSVPIQDRMIAAYFAFGFMNTWLAAVMGLLGLIGIGSGLIRRRADQVLWTSVGLCVPFVLIAVAGVSRAPLPKHVLFVLPVYLVAAALGMETLVSAVTQRADEFSRSAARAVPAIAVAALLLIAFSPILAEHAYVYNDWKGVVHYLERNGHEGDVVVPLTLDLPDGFNEGSIGLAHYLPRAFSNVHLLIGEHLADPANDLDAVSESSGEVWFTLFQRARPVQFNDPDIQVIPFQESIYLVRSAASPRPPLEEMVALYQQIIPQALTPAPQCYLWLDLAILQAQLGRYGEARETASNFQAPCPDTLAARQEVYRRLLDHYQQAQQPDLAREAALQLLALDSKDAQALAALSVFDLSEMFEAGLAEIVESPALPVHRARFSMPQNGDWGDVLLMQTPAQLVYQLRLPDEPIEFRSRIAMAPESWEWGGDGATFVVRVESDAGDQDVLFRQIVSNAEPDRRWHDVLISLVPYAGRTITLTLETAPGPAGDTTGDWAGWDLPRIVLALASAD